MFDTLIHSRPKTALSRRVPGTIMSSVIHGVLIWAAVAATAKSGVVMENGRVDTTVMVFPMEPKVTTPPEHSQLRHPVTLRPQRSGFRTVPPVIDIPTEIPPIDRTERFDPRDFGGIGEEGGVFDGLTDGAPLDPTRTFLVAAVDEPPLRLAGPALRYPDMLRRAGIEGQVVLEFVIDSTGRVEPASLKVISASNRAFESPAREVIVRSRFRPGRVRGIAVRVLVQQSITFAIQRQPGDAR